MNMSNNLATLPLKLRLETFSGKIGFSWLIPYIRIIFGDQITLQLKIIFMSTGLPLLAILGFIFLWDIGSAKVQTSLGRVPGPKEVSQSFMQLVQDHKDELIKEQEFYERQEKLYQKALIKNPNAERKSRKYTGKPTFFNQIVTSLYTVFAGFLIATLVSIPLGILCGLNPIIMRSLNPLIQIFKPVSPLAWLPIVTMVVSALYTTNSGMFEKSFLVSAITVSLCSLWPSLINTSLGVASINKDYINVARVLQLGFFTQIFKIILPASLPLIFTGLRISLGVGWMVLIAAEMLAQNPGLGKFVWDEFQNGSSDSLSRIMVAVFTIGIIGFILDRIMLFLQKCVTFESSPK